MHQATDFILLYTRSYENNEYEYQIEYMVVFFSLFYFTVGMKVINAIVIGYIISSLI